MQNEVNKQEGEKLTLDQQHDLAGRLQLGDHVLERICADHVGALGLVGEKVLDLGHRAVVGADDKALLVHVQYEILAHYGQANECDVGFSA